MDPAEWEQLADRIASELREQIRQVESEFWPEGELRSFRSFWPRVRALNDQVRTAPAIKLDDKLALQKELNELCQRARQDHRRLREQNLANKREIQECIDLAKESLDEAETIDAIQQVRADLRALRERISAPGALLDREDQRAIWSAWQAANQLAWERLNKMWTENEQYLTALLDDARENLARKDVRAAREKIKAFHSAVATHECAHQALREHRTTAGELWQKAESLARKKHEAYLRYAGRRVHEWKAMRESNARARIELGREIGLLEQRARSAPTDVGAALLRGQLEERRRALAQIEATERDLAKQIEEAELALSHS